MLIDDVCDLLLSPAANQSVADVRVGRGYTAVQPDDGHCGLACTLRDRNLPPRPRESWDLSRWAWTSKCCCYERTE